MEDKTVGTLVNHRNIIDATIYRTSNTTLVHGDNYLNGDAIQCFIPNTEIFRVTIPSQEYISNYILKIVWDCLESTIPELVVQVYQDGNLQATKNLIYTSSLGSHILLRFYPTSTYELVFSTASTLNYPVILDYLQLDPLPQNTILSNTSFGDYVDVILRGSTEISGNNTPIVTTTLSNTFPFTTLDQVYVSLSSGNYTHGEWITDINTFGISIRTRDGSNFSSGTTLNVNYMLCGTINMGSEIINQGGGA